MVNPKLGYNRYSSNLSHSLYLMYHASSRTSRSFFPFTASIRDSSGSLVRQVLVLILLLRSPDPGLELETLLYPFVVVDKLSKSGFNNILYFGSYFFLFFFVKVVFLFNLTLQSKKFNCPLIHFYFNFHPHSFNYDFFVVDHFV